VIVFDNFDNFLIWLTLTLSLNTHSDAASTGISLHAARGSGGSYKRRVHYTIELPWSADKAVQQLGRSHRSGQETAPIYKLVVTTLGGETRFAAAVSKRMASLGALTKGDRRAATGDSMLADCDLDSKYGKRALKRFYQALENNERLLSDSGGFNGYITQSSTFPARNTKELLNSFVVQLQEDNDPLAATLPKSETLRYGALLAMATTELDLVGLDVDNRKKADVRIFLNRLAGMPVTQQSLTFSLFLSTFQDVIQDAKATGEYEGTAEDINAEEIKISEELDLAVDPSSGGHTKLTTLALDRGISFPTVCSMAAENISKESTVFVEEDIERMKATRGSKKDNIAPEGFYLSRNKIVGRHFILYAKHKFDRAVFKTSTETAEFDPLGRMSIIRPNTGSGSEMSTQDLKRKYRLLCSVHPLGNCWIKNEHEGAGSLLTIIEEQSKEVADRWRDAFEESNHYIHHNGLAPRRIKVALVTGPVLHVLPALEKAVEMRSETARGLKIMRAQVNDRRLVGVRFPTDDDAIAKLRAEITTLLNARSQSGKTFVDEELAPICRKSREWATTERKTMKSFFAVKPKSSCSSSRGKTGAQEKSETVQSSRAKRSASSAKSVKEAISSSKRLKSITRFFAPLKKP